LTTKEFDILVLFARNGGIALSRRQIIQNVWGENYFGSDRVVDDLIRRIRKKTKHFEVETLYGYGYRVYS
jgi:two-component system response regulator CssR